jgi:hypothetical protein
LPNEIGVEVLALKQREEFRSLVLGSTASHAFAGGIPVPGDIEI